jgi:apolipoprotein D and lipocalin family protein
MPKFLALIFILFLAGCSGTYAPLPTTKQVDLERYQGTWYEIARYKHFFERGCKNVSAEYTLEADQVRVTNRCTKIDDNATKEAHGVAYASDTTNAKLRVSFFRPFYGDYWILDLDKNYQYALVGAPNREYLWILNRTKKMQKNTLDAIVAKLDTLGFDANKLIWTIQE